MKQCLVEQVRTGGDRNFGYLACDGPRGRGALIDPSYSPHKLLARAVELEVTVDCIFITHGHGDHSAGAAAAERETGCRRIGWGDAHPVTGERIVHGATFPLGGLEAKILHTPGHTPDSICILVGDALFTGDTLFVGKVGGTDFGTGARKQFDSLRRIILPLPDETRVFPGHDYGASPVSTVGEERLTNPFLMREDFAAFLDLKENWADYKRRHGIV